MWNRWYIPPLIYFLSRQQIQFARNKFSNWRINQYYSPVLQHLKQESLNFPGLPILPRKSCIHEETNGKNYSGMKKFLGTYGLSRRVKFGWCPYKNHCSGTAHFFPAYFSIFIVMRFDFHTSNVSVQYLLFTKYKLLLSASIRNEFHQSVFTLPC